MCYEEHKKKYPDESVQVTEISKKCADKWKVCFLFITRNKMTYVFYRL